MTPQDRRGNRYLINFVDHKSNYARIFLGKTKDQAAKQFEHFLAFFEKRFDCKVHVLRTDGGAEYTNVDWFCRKNGVERQISEPGNQASNGKAERMHRTIMGMARSMLFASPLPLSFWGDAVVYAAYILNRSPSKSNSRRASPLEVLTGVAPNVKEIAVFGSPCMVYRDPGNARKDLKKRSEAGVIIGISEEIKGYIVFLKVTKKVIVTTHVKAVDSFTEEENQELNRRANQESEGEKPTRTPRPLLTTKRKKWSPSERMVTRKSKGYQRKGNETRDAPIQEANSIETDPRNFRQAMQSADRDCWMKAIQDELKSLEEKKTWVMVYLPMN